MKQLSRFAVLLIVTACVSLACALPAHCAIICVNWDSPNNGPGNDWDHAYRTVTAGLAAAVSGDEVWVARGTYVGCVFVESGIALYGGFAGGETARDQRNWTANVTILDGNQVDTVVCMGMTDARIDGFTIRNGSGFTGGAVACSDSTATVANNTMTGNYGYKGGGVWVLGGAPVITGNTITANDAWMGFGVYVASGSPIITNNTITTNTGNGSGGGVYVWEGAPTIANNTISGHTAGYGGGIFLRSSAGAVVIAGNRIEGNHATELGGGGAIQCSGSSPSIINNLIAGNTANSDCGISSYGVTANPVLVNNTITGNIGGCAFGASYGAPVVRNNIFAFNSYGIGRYDPYGTGITVENNCFYANDSYGEGTPTNITADPLFVDRTGGDYHLRPGSPCIDEGTPTGAPDDDLDGLSRPRDGDGNGSAVVDIGCYECPNNYVSIAGAKALLDGASVGIAWPITTALFGGRFYAESSDRVTGIGVLGSASGAGKHVVVEGTMTTVDGERLIQPNSVFEGPAAPIPQPWFMNALALGGGACGLQSGVADWRDMGGGRQLVLNGGANNIGLLVKMTGLVGYRGTGFFYLDGGCTFDDGDENIKGIRVDWPFADPLPAEDSFVEIVGVSSCRISEGQVVRLLRPLSADSVRVLE